MKKLKMREYVVHMMAQWGQTSLLISCLKDGASYVMQKAGVVACDEFNATLPCVLQVVKDEPEVFKIGRDTRYLELVHADKLNAYVEKWKIVDEINCAIKEYVQKAQAPVFYASVDLKQEVETERQMKEDTKYIEWICEMLGVHDSFRNTDFALAKNGEEVLKLLMLYNLFFVTKQYCKKNLIYYSITDISESYVIVYTLEDKNVYIKITEFSQDDVKTYEVRKWFETRNVAYFQDIALGEPSKDFKRKKKMLRELEERFSQANRLGIPYERIKYVLEKVYNYYDD